MKRRTRLRLGSLCRGTGTQNRRGRGLFPSPVKPSSQKERRTERTTNASSEGRGSVAVADDRPLGAGTVGAEGVEFETEEILIYFHRAYVLVPR